MPLTDIYPVVRVAQMIFRIKAGLYPNWC